VSQRKAWGIARSIVEKSSLDRFGGTSAQYRTVTRSGTRTGFIVIASS